MNIFKRQTPEEAMRESKRDIRRGQRDIERDVREMERQEKQLIIEIKALAKKGDNASAKIMTKQLLNVRKQKEKLLTSKGAPSPTK
jgi:charged multivesicular body protein 2B